MDRIINYDKFQKENQEKRAKVKILLRNFRKKRIYKTKKRNLSEQKSLILAIMNYWKNALSSKDIEMIEKNRWRIN